MTVLKKNLVGVTTSIIMAVTGAAGATDYTLKLAHNGPEQHPFQDGAIDFKEQLEASSNGEIEVLEHD